MFKKVYLEKLELSAPLGGSDHLVMNATFTLANNMQYAATSKRIWSKCDEQKVDFMGKNTNWSFSIAEWDIEGMWDELHSKIIAIIAVNDRVVPLKRPDSNSKTKTAKESAEVFANYFASVFTNKPFGPLRKECYASIPGVSHIRVMQIDDKEVCRLINSLNIHKSQGPDEIHLRVLKVLSKNPMFVHLLQRYQIFGNELL